MTTIKALTICQPYAHLIVIGEKRVENRGWPIGYRGPLLIHAGKSRGWLEDGDDERFPDMAYGAIVGVADLIACLNIDVILASAPLYCHYNEKSFDLNWLREHEHTEGPWCFVLNAVRRFKEPIPYSGKQGPFDVPITVVHPALAEVT